MRRLRGLRRPAQLCALLLVTALAGVPIYVRPQVDPLQQSDAIFILGGFEYDRYVLGLRLGAEKWAPDVVVSNPIGAGDPYLTEYCKKPNPDFKLYCFVPNPPTTAGEARELKRLAAENRWHTITVVTFAPQISRARFILGQCFGGRLLMVKSPPQPSLARWVYEYVYQTAGYIKALLQPAC